MCDHPWPYQLTMAKHGWYGSTTADSGYPKFCGLTNGPWLSMADRNQVQLCVTIRDLTNWRWLSRADFDLLATIDHEHKIVLTGQVWPVLAKRDQVWLAVRRGWLTVNFFHHWIEWYIFVKSLVFVSEINFTDLHVQVRGSNVLKHGSWQGILRGF